jgi:hypothetical protein
VQFPPQLGLDGSGGRGQSFGFAVIVGRKLCPALPYRVENASASAPASDEENAVAAELIRGGQGQVLELNLDAGSVIFLASGPSPSAPIAYQPNALQGILDADPRVCEDADDCFRVLPAHGKPLEKREPLAQRSRSWRVPGPPGPRPMPCRRGVFSALRSAVGGCCTVFLLTKIPDAVTFVNRRARRRRRSSSLRAAPCAPSSSPWSDQT